MSNEEMNSQELKEAIALDIETLKTLDVDIMPAKEYYQANRRLFLHVFFKLYGTILLGFLLPLPFYWKVLMVETSTHELIYIFFWLPLMALGLCLFVFLFIYSSLNQYILI
ncbi:TPA: hypothetical protein ACQDQW_001704, partial [Legionella pneumophila]